MKTGYFYKIFFDFEGTLVDIRKKYYQIYKDIMKENGFKPVAEKVYWKIRPYPNGWKEALKKSGCPKSFTSKFAKRFKEREFSKKYLKYEKPIVKKEFLLRLSKKAKLFIVSQRNVKSLDSDIKKFGLERFFEKIVKTDDKEKAIRNIGYDRNSIIVGDTKKDVICGKRLRIKIVAVLSGMRDKEFLKKFNPDLILKSVNQLRIR